MVIPKFSTGLTNYYETHVSSSVDSASSVLTISLDSLCINQRIALVKIDAEGHESFVLAGMQRLIQRDHPVLIVETGSKEVIANLTSLGYIPDELHRTRQTFYSNRMYEGPAF